jgi:preprotein translocase subunit SecG
MTSVAFAINWLNISINLLLVVFVIVCLLMTVIILMQRPKQEGLGAAFGSGVTDQVFGARTTNVLQRGTVYLGSLFFILSLALATLIGYQNKKVTLKGATPPAAASEAAAPAAPDAAQPKSLSDELPAATPAPAPEAAPAPAVEATPAPAPAPAAEAAPAPTGEAQPAPPADGQPAQSGDKPGQP